MTNPMQPAASPGATHWHQPGLNLLGHHLLAARQNTQKDEEKQSSIGVTYPRTRFEELYHCVYPTRNFYCCIIDPESRFSGRCWSHGYFLEPNSYY